MEENNFGETTDDQFSQFSEIRKELKSKMSNIQHENEISDLTFSIEALKTENLNLKDENCQLKLHNQEIERQLLEKENEITKYQQELHTSQVQYNQLVSKLLQSFNVHSIENVFDKSDESINLQSQVSDLKKKLWETQLQFSNESIKQIERAATPSFSVLNEEDPQNDLLKGQLRQKESTINQLQSELLSIKSENETIQKEYAKKTIENQTQNSHIEQLETELEKTSEELAQLKVTQTKGLLEALNRLSALKVFSKRLDPNFLSIEPTNVLYSILDNLSMLLLSMSDMEIENQVVIECLGKVIGIVQNAVSQIGKMTAFSEPEVDDHGEELQNLFRELGEKNEEIESLKNEVLDLQENDATPELASWMNKCRALEREIVHLKKNQLKSPDRQPKVMQRRPLQPISLPQTLV